ncbi:hypothetical protein IWX65_003215 [Arthrobacter sp. CAN_A214]
METVSLPYTNFSIVMRPDKRLAAITALGIDAEKLRDISRSSVNWRLDPPLPEGQQTGERVNARNDIDSGHLVRRASAAWGDTGAQFPWNLLMVCGETGAEFPEEPWSLHGYLFPELGQQVSEMPSRSQ